MSGIHIVGARASRSHTLQRSINETQGYEETAPQEVTSGKWKPKWFQETLKEAKEYVGEPQRLMRESRAPERLGSYLAMVTSIIDSKPTTFVQEADQQVWREDMQEEYDSIMHNDMWEVVPRPEGMSVVTSR
jgi:hypothetical protein